MGRTPRSASCWQDLRTLADRFAPGRGPHRLFHATFGLWPAATPTCGRGRPTLQPTGPGGGGPVGVAPSLRTTGTLDQRGRSRRWPTPTPGPRLEPGLRPSPPTTRCGAALITDGAVRPPGV